MSVIVQKTGRFGTFEILNSQGNVVDIASVNDFIESSVVNVGKGKRLTIAEVAKVAVSESAVVVYEIAGQESEAKDEIITRSNAANVSALIVSSSQSYLSQECSRAGIMARLVSLLQGQLGLRDCILNRLVDLLNDRITPCFTVVSNASSSSTANEEATRHASELIAALTGVEGSKSFDDGEIEDTSKVLKNNGYEPLLLTKLEIAKLSSIPFVATGVACLVAAGTMNLVNTVDAISALSCEAVGASTEAFDATNFDTYRQHRGQINSAANLRALLDGSKRINAKDSNDHDGAFATLPQVTGPAVELTASAAKALEIELNSGDSAALVDAGVTVAAAQSLLGLDCLTSCLQTLIDASAMRRAGIQKQSCSPRTLFTAKKQVGYSASLNLLADLRTALGAELEASLTSIGETAAVAIAPVAAAGATVANDEAAEAAKDAKSSKKPAGQGKAVDLDQLSEKERAKVEAIRKQKAEKAALKAAQKESKKAGGAGLVAAKPIGAGSELVKAAVLASTKGSLSASLIARRLDPFNFSASGLTSTLIKLIEGLNSSGKRKPKIAKGARDFTPEQMRIREQAFSVIRRVFKRHGGVEIDTPVFELKEVLTGKYGEDSKLIYDLADQGGELLSLRYDLTVPFARFLAMNSVGNIKRYHIAKVYRRDQPQAARGRYREFYQCDFDIAGSYTPMVPDAEVITVAAEILSDLPVGNFLIKLNHRKLLDAIFELCGVPLEKFRPICSAIDKLDKEPWSAVRDEMVLEKGLSEETADKIGVIVQNHGQPNELLARFLAEKTFGEHVAANEALRDLGILFKYLDAMGSLPYVSFDMSLARGLDYYTGVIYEVVLTDGTSQVGSIAAGGRYDNLVGMFSASGTQTPCVGVSIGIERVFAIMESKAKTAGAVQAPLIQVYIASIGPDLVPDRMKIARLLWTANISAEFSHLENPRLKKQMDEVLESGIPFMVIFGAEEIARGTVKVKNMKLHVEKEVTVVELVSTLIELGCSVVPAGIDTSFMDSMRTLPSSESTA